MLTKLNILLLLIGYNTECKLEPMDKDILFGLISLRLSLSIVALNAIESKYLGLFALAVGWIGSITRVADPNLVSGVGSLFVLLGGVSIASSVRQTLAEFTRKEVYEKV